MTFKPLTQTEMKIIIFNKVKHGLSYPDAVKQLSLEIECMRKAHKSHSRSLAKSSTEEERDRIALADMSNPFPELRIKKKAKLNLIPSD